MNDKRYRKNVGLIVLNENNKLLICKRKDKSAWQFPQGGIDKGENPLDAAYRELNEETSIRSVKLIQEVEGEITYNLPDNLVGIIWKGKFKGQTQKWFIMRFLGKDVLNLKFNANKSYWIEKTGPKSKMKNQF